VCGAPNNPDTPWPVNYHSGQISMSVLDIDISFGTISFSQRRDYDYLKRGSINGLNGFSWRTTRVPTTKLIPDFAYRTEFSDDDTVKSANGYAILDDDEQIIDYTLVNPVSITIQDTFGNVTNCSLKYNT
jgi:hypothetical protein